MAGTVLQHLPFSSGVDISFWSSLSTLKLDELRLSDSARKAWGTYSTRAPPSSAPNAAATPAAAGSGAAPAAPSAVARLSVFGESFEGDCEPPQRAVRATGTVTVVNTADAFKEVDKKALLQKAGEELCAAVDSGEALRNPHLLVRFDLLVYSDMKNYKHTYWFAFPALCPPAPPTLASAAEPSSSQFSAEELSQVRPSLRAARTGQSLAAWCPAWLAIPHRPASATLSQIDAGFAALCDAPSGMPPFCVITITGTGTDRAIAVEARPRPMTLSPSTPRHAPARAAPPRGTRRAPEPRRRRRAGFCVRRPVTSPREPRLAAPQPPIPPATAPAPPIREGNNSAPTPKTQNGRRIPTSLCHQ